MQVTLKSPNACIDSHGGVRKLDQYLEERCNEITFEEHCANITTLLRAACRAFDKAKGDQGNKNLQAICCNVAAYSLAAGARKLNRRIAQGWERFNFYSYISSKPPVSPSESRCVSVSLPESADQIPFLYITNDPHTMKLEVDLMKEYVSAEKAIAFQQHGYGSEANRRTYDTMLRCLISSCEEKVQGLVKSLDPNSRANGTVSGSDLMGEAYETYAVLIELLHLVNHSTILPLHLKFIELAFGLTSTKPKSGESEELSTAAEIDEPFHAVENVQDEDDLEVEGVSSTYWSDACLRYLKSITRLAGAIFSLLPAQGMSTYQRKLIQTLKINVLAANIKADDSNRKATTPVRDILERYLDDSEMKQLDRYTQIPVKDFEEKVHFGGAIHAEVLLLSCFMTVQHIQVHY